MKIKRIYVSVISVVIMLGIFLLFIVLVKSSVDFDELDNKTFDTYQLSEELSSIDDGIYFGEYEIFPLSINVHLYIENHELIDVMMHGHSLFFDEEAFEIVDQILINQSLDVNYSEDNVSSEKILILAIINGLEEQFYVESI
jgi:uncharacterized protein with FMN-binding domain